MNALTSNQIDNNEACRESWERFRSHRDRVTALLRGASTGGRLCVLGAGNCNDLDLNALLEVFREVYLADLDDDALRRGVARQGLAGSSRVHLQGGLDLTGMLDRMAGWSPTAPISDDDLAACAERPRLNVRPTMPLAFDVVASCCLLSQLINCVVRSAGERHPRFLAAFQAVRAGHFRLLVDLVAPGGVGILITDFVSSDTFAPLASVAERELPAVAGHLLRQKNFFHGVNPTVLASVFRTDSVIAVQIATLEGSGLWQWDFGPRVYLVCAAKFRKVLQPPG